MRVTLCRSRGSEVHGGQNINQLQQSQYTLLLIGPFSELADNPSLRFLQLKRLISPHDAMFWKHELKVRPFAYCRADASQHGRHHVIIPCRQTPQLLHLQNRRVFFSIYRWCTCSRRSASWSFLNRDIEQSTLSSRLVQGARSVRWSLWNNKYTICGNGERQQNWNLRIK